MFGTESKLLVIFVTTIELISLLEVGTALPISPFTNHEAAIYLKTFGWLNTNYTEEDPESVYNFRKSLEKFQEFQGLKTTGRLDKSTIQIMKSPRCGVSDKPKEIRNVLFEIEIPRWEVMNLTYNISKYPTSLQTLGGPQRIDEEIRKAFTIWKLVSEFKFTPTTEKADIDISFETKQHNDGLNFSFDGTELTLAHASSPPGGVIRFNDEQNWTLESNQGINFLQIAVHQIGHALGLGHSKIGNALMFPIYTGHMGNFRLSSDDTQKIRALYKRNRPTPLANRPPQSNGPSLTERNSTSSQPTFGRPPGVSQQRYNWRSVNEPEMRHPPGRSGFMPPPRRGALAEKIPRPEVTASIQDRQWDDPIVLRETVPSHERPTGMSIPLRNKDGNVRSSEISSEASELRRRWDRPRSLLPPLERSEERGSGSGTLQRDGSKDGVAGRPTQVPEPRVGRVTHWSETKNGLVHGQQTDVPTHEYHAGGSAIRESRASSGQTHAIQLWDDTIYEPRANDGPTPWPDTGEAPSNGRQQEVVHYPSHDQTLGRLIGQKRELDY